ERAERGAGSIIGARLAFHMMKCEPGTDYLLLRVIFLTCCHQEMLGEYDGCMPRRPRIHLPGLPIHLVQRGHNRRPCFFQEQDYQLYLRWLREALEKTGCELHAYVLMTNHVHL